MRGLALAAAALVLFAGCTGEEAGAAVKPAAPLTPPVQLCRTKSHGSCRTAIEVEGWLADPRLEIIGAARTPAGIQRARVLTLRLPGRRPIVFRAKWRALSTETLRNSPRRELGAYAVQKLFLEPHEYVAPPAAAHCFPLAEYRRKVDAKARPGRRDRACVPGVLSYWLEDVQELSSARESGWFDGEGRHMFDPRLYEDNRIYRESVQAVNLFTYLIAHGDSHRWNFVITEEPEAPRVYSVDNSISLGMARNRKLGRRNDWSRLRVPALRKQDVERLRNVDGRLDSLRIYGLTEAEIAGLRGRISDLLAQVDAGELRLE